MLADITVVEISHPHTAVGGQILADLGARVIVIEPPTGSPMRRMEPFRDGPLTAESSLFWQAYNRGKHGVTLDLETPDGAHILRGLLGRADVLLRAKGQQIIPDAPPETIVDCVVRPFSRTGPRRDFAYTDMTLHASTGSPAATGNPDRAPLMLPTAPPVLEAGAEAAIGILGALLARSADGGGQQVGVSARIAAMMSALSAPYVALAPEWNRTRSTGTVVADVALPNIVPCKDGFVLVSIAFGGFVGMTERLAALVCELGYADPGLAKTQWRTFVADYQAGALENKPLLDLVDAVLRFALASSKSQIVDYAQEHRFFAAPMMEMSDIAEFDQYRDRGLFQPLSLFGDEVPFPATFARVPGVQIGATSPAPTLSQHTHEVLADLGYAPSEQQAMFAASII